jgi:uncharacterized protein (TIGR03435 family)
MVLPCQTVAGFATLAYIRYADGRSHPFYDVGRGGTTVAGGPAWTRTEQFTTTAKASRPAQPAMMQGPMLRAILEERFALKVHRETRDADVYALITTKSGPKLPPFIAGTCVPLAPNGESPALGPGEHYCESMVSLDGGMLWMHAQGASLDEFARAFLSGPLSDRPVVDRTGLSGLYDITLTVPVPTGGGTDAAFDVRGSLITALQEQLGLKLEPRRGRADYLVIDHAEPPTEN